MSSGGLSILRLTFLGTSAAAPTLHRNVSGVAVKADSQLLLFDCGEGSQRQMIRFGTGFTVDAAFFTHFHADHYLGIIGFLRTLGMGGRTEPIHLYGPAPARKLLDAAVHLGVERLAFPIEIHELTGGDRIDRGGFSVTAVRVDHRVNAVGYVIAEDIRPGRFDLEAARRLGVTPGPDYGRLQKGERVKTADGTEVGPEQVLGPPREGRRVVLSGDTRPCLSLTEAAAGADLLIHESTFGDEEQERALETRHSTAREAARVAREAKVKRLVLTHLSSRYDVEFKPLLEQARQEFTGLCEVAFDGLTIELPARE